MSEANCVNCILVDRCGEAIDIHNTYNIQTYTHIVIHMGGYVHYIYMHVYVGILIIFNQSIYEYSK